MISLGVQVLDVLPFSSSLGPLLAVLDHLFTMSIYMICSCHKRCAFPRKILTLRLFTLNSLLGSDVINNTIIPSSMISLKMPSYGPITKLTLALLKVVITGYSPLRDLVITLNPSHCWS
jgi:hypothetical protein